MNEIEVIEQTLPASEVSAEMATLGSFMLDHGGGIRRRIMSLIRPESFELPEHQQVARLAWEMQEQGKPFDSVTLFAAAKATGISGALSLITDCLNYMPSAANGEHYAMIVRKAAALRFLQAAGNRLARDAQDQQSDPAAMMRRMREGIDTFLRRYETGRNEESGADAYGRRLEAIIDGSIANIPFYGLPKVSAATKALLNGSLSLTVGFPGDGKTFLVLSSVHYWIDSGIPVSVLSAEEGMEWLMGRSMAMIWQDWRMLDENWIKANADVVRDRKEASNVILEKIGNAFTFTKIDRMGLNQVVDWVDAESEKSRVIVIDPITAFSSDGSGPVRSPKEDTRFVGRLKEIAERKKVAIWAIGHPSKQPKDRNHLTLGDIPGGAAYGNFVSCVMFLYAHKPPKAVEVYRDGMGEQMECNRTIFVEKARNAKGGGVTFAMNLGNDVAWHELGVVMKELKKRDTALDLI